MNMGLFGGFVRQAYLAQQAVEQWKDGTTPDVWGGTREVDLATLEGERDCANLSLIRFVEEGV